MDTVQEQFDSLVSQYGAESVLNAIKNHTIDQDPSLNLPSGCNCPTGYICNSAGGCTLAVG